MKNRIMVDEEMARSLAGVSFLIGNTEMVKKMQELPALEPFTEILLDMLNEVSRLLITDREAKQYPDVITFAFWVRRSSTVRLKERFHKEDGNVRLGRGVAFHIAPSNVPVNFAYSLVAGLLTGNANVVRVSSKDFPQVEIISRAFKIVLSQEEYNRLEPYICLVKYGREKEINDLFSSMADVRVVWGGDNTIAELRKSPLAPRAGEITFADRFSLAVIDSDCYLSKNSKEKERTAEDFYNDTYLTDQNACTSPRLVAWLGEDIDCINEAKKEFWRRLHEVVRKKYRFQSIQGINKLTSSCLAAAAYMTRPEASSGAGQRGSLSKNSKQVAVLQDSARTELLDGSLQMRGVKIVPCADNLLVRVRVPYIAEGLMDLKDNCGYFFEYDCKDILELKGLCNDERCQTITYIGGREKLRPLLISGIHGVDRVVPMGKTMDFDLVWDGYNLYERLTRTVYLG